MNGGWDISYKIALIWMPIDLTDDKSTSVQIMAWCRQATSHYLSQCWPRPLSPYGANNLLAPGKFQFNFRKSIFKLILVNGGWGISYKIALIWMPLDLTDDKSTSVQVMAWCRQATSHYLSQCFDPDLCHHMASLGLNELSKEIFHHQVNCLKSSNLLNIWLPRMKSN